MRLPPNSSWCELMSVKVLNALGSGYLDTVALGVTYAADEGARVINLSLGATTGAARLEQAVTYAWQQGALVVTCPIWPACSCRRTPSAPMRTSGP